MLKNIFTWSIKFFQPVKKPVGRWIVNDDKAILRATLANMDSCGDSLCGTPSTFKKITSEFSKKKKINL